MTDENGSVVIFKKIPMLETALAAPFQTFGDEDAFPSNEFHNFRCTSSMDMFYPLLARRVKYFKETEGGRKIVCKAFEDLAEKRI